MYSTDTYQKHVHISYAVKKLFVRVILYKFVFSVYYLNHLCQKKGGQFRKTLFSVDFNTFLFRTKCLLIIFKTRNIRIMMKTNFKILFCGRKRGAGMSEMSNSLEALSFSLLKSLLTRKGFIFLLN